MKKFVMRVAQNGGEYYGYTSIKCNELIRDGSRKVIADGIEIEFDEYIECIIEKENE